jgi:hypothetical protein
LILAAGFVIGGGTSAGAAMSPATVKNTCSSNCVNLQNQASGQSAVWTTMPSSNYCATYVVTGQTAKVQCSAPAVGAACTVTFQDGTSCSVGCTSGSTTITCA